MYFVHIWSTVPFATAPTPYIHRLCRIYILTYYMYTRPTSNLENVSYFTSLKTFSPTYPIHTRVQYDYSDAYTRISRKQYVIIHRSNDRPRYLCAVSSVRATCVEGPARTNETANRVKEKKNLNRIDCGSMCINSNRTG